MATGTNFDFFDLYCDRYKDLCGALRRSLKNQLSQAVAKASQSPDDPDLSEKVAGFKAKLAQLHKDIAFYEKQLDHFIKIYNSVGLKIHFEDVCAKLSADYAVDARGDQNWRTPPPPSAPVRVNEVQQRSRMQEARAVFEQPAEGGAWARPSGIPQRRLSFGSMTGPMGRRTSLDAQQQQQISGIPRLSMGGAGMAAPPPRQSFGGALTGAISRRPVQQQQQQSGIPRLSMGAPAGSAFQQQPDFQAGRRLSLNVQPSRIQPPRQSLGAAPHPMAHTGAIPRRSLSQQQLYQQPPQPPQTPRVSLNTVAANSLADFNRVVGLVKVMMMQELGFEVPIENTPITDEREALQMLAQTQFRLTRNPRLLERHVRMLLSAAHAAKLLKSSAIAQQVLQELANLRQALARNEPLPPVKLPLSNLEVGTRAFRQLLGAALSINNSLQAACAENPGQHGSCATCKERNERLKNLMAELEGIAQNDWSVRDKSVSFMNAIRQLNESDLRCDPIEGLRNAELDERIRDLNERLPAVLLHLENIVRTDEKTPKRKPKTPEVARPAGYMPQSAQDVCIARFRQLYREAIQLNDELLKACANDARCHEACSERCQRLRDYAARKEDVIARYLANNERASMNIMLMGSLEEINEADLRCAVPDGMQNPKLRSAVKDLTHRIQNALQEQKNQVRIDEKARIAKADAHNRTQMAAESVRPAGQMPSMSSLEECIRRFQKLCNDALANNEAVIEGCGTDPAYQEARGQCIQLNNALKLFIVQMKQTIEDAMAAGGPAGVNRVLLDALVELNKLDATLCCPMPHGMRNPQLRNRIGTLVDDVQRAIQVQRNQVLIDRAARPAAVEPQPAPAARPAGQMPPSIQEESIQQFRRYSNEAMRINEELLAAGGADRGCAERNAQLQQLVAEVNATVKTALAEYDKPTVNKTLLSALLRLNELRCELSDGTRNPALQARITALATHLQGAAAHMRNLVRIDEQARHASQSLQQPAAPAAAPPRERTAEAQAQWRAIQERTAADIQRAAEARQRRADGQMAATGDESRPRVQIDPEERRMHEERVSKSIRYFEEKGREKVAATTEPTTTTGRQSLGGAPFPLTEEEHRQRVQQSQRVAEQVRRYEQIGKERVAGTAGVQQQQPPPTTTMPRTAEQQQQWQATQERRQEEIRRREEIGRDRRLGATQQPVAVSRPELTEEQRRQQATLHQRNLEELRMLEAKHKEAAAQAAAAATVERAPLTEAERQQLLERQQTVRKDIRDHQRRMLGVVAEEDEAAPLSPATIAAKKLMEEERLNRVAEMLTLVGKGGKLKRERSEPGYQPPIEAKPRRKLTLEKRQLREKRDAQNREVIEKMHHTGDRRRGVNQDYGGWSIVARHVRPEPGREDKGIGNYDLAVKTGAMRRDFEEMSAIKNRLQNRSFEKQRMVNKIKQNPEDGDENKDEPEAEDWMYRVGEVPAGPARPQVEYRRQRTLTREEVREERVVVPSPMRISGNAP